MSRRLVFLCSGGGGNLRVVHTAVENGWLADWQLVAVIADRPCKALEYAEANGISSRHVDFRSDGQRLVESILRDLNPDAIVTNVHRILSEAIVHRFEGRLINLHYSLLPAFGGVIGAVAVQQALAYGELIVGVTAHHVTSELDKGPPIVQIAIPVGPGDRPEQVMDLQFRAGAIALVSTLSSLAAPRPPHAVHGVLIGGRPCLVSPAVALPEELERELFWARLK